MRERHRLGRNISTLSMNLSVLLFLFTLSFSGLEVPQNIKFNGLIYIQVYVGTSITSLYVLGVVSPCLLLQALDLLRLFRFYQSSGGRP